MWSDTAEYETVLSVSVAHHVDLKHFPVTDQYHISPLSSLHGHVYYPIILCSLSVILAMLFTL